MPLNEKSLKTSLDSGALYPVYLIYGNDSFLKKQAIDRIVKATVDPNDDLNLLRYEGAAPLQEMYNELNGFPVMADRKCVILSDFDYEAANENDFQMFLSLASDKYESSVFVVCFDTVVPDTKKSERTKKLFAGVTACGGATVLLDHRTRDELARQLSASAKKQGALLSPKNAGYLIDTCSTDTQTLINELSKLVAYSNGQEITRSMIEKVAVKSIDASVYELATKIIKGDNSGAMALLDDLYFMKIAPEIIVYSISSTFVDMFRVAAAKESGLRPEEIADTFKMRGREFVLSRAAGNLNKYDYKKLELSFDALIDSDRKIKSYSSNNRLILEELIVKLIYIMKTGEAL